MARLISSLFLLLPTCGLPLVGWSEEASRVTQAEVDKAWMEHLTFELYRAESEKVKQELICRKILQENPRHRPALQVLMFIYLTRGEAILSDMVQEYSLIAGVEPVLPQPAEAGKLLKALKSKAGEEDILWKSWHELYEEDFAKFSGRFSEPVFERMEDRIRKYIQRSPEDLDKKLQELSRLLAERGEMVMVAMVSNYLRVRFPDDVSFLQISVDSMQEIGLENVIDDILLTYRSRKTMPVDVLGFLTRECMEQGIYKDVLYYADRWRLALPDNPLPLTFEGASWVQLNNVSKAEGALLAATHLPGHSSECYRLLARIYAEYGDENQTLIWLERLKPHLDDETMSKLLGSKPFNRMPLLMLKLVD